MADPGFPVGGRGPPMWALFGVKVCENKRIGSHRGRALGMPPDPPMFIKEKCTIIREACSHSILHRERISNYRVRSNLHTHLSDTPFTIPQPIRRPHLLERVYKPIRTPHWCGVLQSSTTESIRDRV